MSIDTCKVMTLEIIKVVSSHEGLQTKTLFTVV